MQAFTVMATVCAGLSIPLLAVSYAKDCTRSRERDASMALYADNR